MTVRQLHFESGTPGPHLVILSGVHGDEFEPLLAVQQLHQWFQQDSTRLHRGRLTLIPTANESACELGRRCGSDGLDLARTFPGSATGSLTERAACEITEILRSADLIIDLHTGGTELSVAPLCGYMLHSEPAILQQQRRMARAMNLPIIWGTTPRLEGRSLSVARDAGVPAVYCEYLGGAACSADGIAAYVQGSLSVMALVEMTDGPLVPASSQRVFEDHSPDSGHLQICNPSPCNGVFHATVALGQSVEQGSQIGILLQPATGVQHSIRAHQSGIVLVLRTFPHVQQGQSLFVILPSP